MSTWKSRSITTYYIILHNYGLRNLTFGNISIVYKILLSFVLPLMSPKCIISSSIMFINCHKWRFNPPSSHTSFELGSLIKIVWLTLFFLHIRISVKMWKRSKNQWKLQSLYDCPWSCHVILISNVNSIIFMNKIVVTSWYHWSWLNLQFYYNYVKFD